MWKTNRFKNPHIYFVAPNRHVNQIKFFLKKFFPSASSSGFAILYLQDFRAITQIQKIWIYIFEILRSKSITKQNFISQNFPLVSEMKSASFYDCLWNKILVSNQTWSKTLIRRGNAAESPVAEILTEFNNFCLILNFRSA